jgi:transcriptional regulator with XRE-family HTH domain
MLATAREQSRAFSFLRSLRPFSIGDLIMPVVDERLIAKAKTLRAQGMTQDEIAVELGVVQSTVSTILRQHGLGGKLVKAQKLRRKIGLQTSGIASVGAQTPDIRRWLGERIKSTHLRRSTCWPERLILDPIRSFQELAGTQEWGRGRP